MSALLVVGPLLASACVDGTTPDCSTIDSGCYPSDSSILPDVGDAGDASTDAQTDADASTVDAPVD